MQDKLRLFAIMAALVLFVLPAGGLSAQTLAPPVMFEGTVTIGGVSAPDGTAVAALIEGDDDPFETTTVGGGYSLPIEGTTGRIGELVTFTVNGVVGGQTVFPDPMLSPIHTTDLETYTLSVTIDPPAGGTVNLDPPDGDAVTPEAQYPSVDPVTVTLTAVPAAGYGFDGWTGDLTGDTNPETLLMDDNKDVTAHFEVRELEDPAVSTLAATGVTHNRATLNGNLTDIGDYTQVRVRFQWGTTMAYGNETPWQTRTGTGSFNALITGLAPETTYHFRAQVETIAPSNTVTEHGENMTFTTGEQPDALPAVGGTGYPTNRLALLAPWLGLAAVVAGALVFVRRRHAQS